MVYPILEPVLVKKPFNWSRETSNIPCQNPSCRYTTWEKNHSPLRSYSPGEDNRDGNVRLNNGGFCLNCLSDIEEEIERGW